MLPPVDIAYIADELRTYSQELVEAFEDSDSDADSDPRILIQALNDLFEGLCRLEEDALDRLSINERFPPMGEDLGALGDHAIDLLARLAALASKLPVVQSARGIEELALPLACWAARRGAELSHLEPVVNSAANLANRLAHPTELGELYGLLTEVVNAVNPQISQDTISTDPARPWRVLLLNRAIVATRSHRPALMEEAFDAIIEYLPQEAAVFFREGMEQMDLLNYPPHVRDLMRRYYDQWCEQRLLH